jgi:BirA family biotin operon repressor/biotin-[acetyl-CoA-carboxylase] ligase
MTPPRRPLGHEIVRLEEAPSTNTLLLENEAWLDRHGLVVLARHQTAGRGRMGRTWSSVPGAQLQFSVAVHPQVPGADVPIIALIAGLAVAQAIGDATGLRPELHWPNDVFIAGRKVCGILAEAKPSAAGALRLVVGIGINCLGSAADYPLEVRGLIITLEEAAGRPVDPEALLRAVLGRFDALLARLDAGGREELLAEWRRHARLAGARVRFPLASGRVTGSVLGLTPEGFLRARDGAGGVHTLVSGDVEWL